MRITQLFKPSKKHSDDWPEPETLRNTLRPVNPLVTDNIPVPFYDWILDVSDRMQCPPDFIAVAAIVTTSAIIGTGCGVKPKQKDDWLVIPNLWGGIVGRPGMLKTPAVSEVMQILNQIESESTKAYQVEFKNYQAELELYKTEREAIKCAMLNSYKQGLKNGSNSLETLSLKDQLMKTKEPSKPIWNRFKTNDTTIEKLCELLVDNPRGLLLYRDELIGLLTSWDKEGRESDRAFFLEAWNGYGSLTTDRISRGTVHIENLCISIFGNTQPTKLSRYLHSAIRGIDNDGLLQRFQLLIFPNEKCNWQLIDKSANKQARERAALTIRRLAKMNFFELGALKESNSRFPYFGFDENAQELFYIWLTKLECEKLNADDHPILIEHLAKYRSLMPSLALIFHLLDIADGKVNKRISLDHALKAIAWCDYLEKHARRIYGMANDITKQAAINLSKKIQKGLLPSPFSIRDVYRKEWALLNEKEMVKKACEELMDASWLRVSMLNSDIGRPKLPTYIINPKIKIEQVNEENFF
jgi:Protein of unknown function (DUF3987)